MFEVKVNGAVVYVRFYGEVTPAELTRVVHAAAGHPDFETQRFHVVDWTDAVLPALDDDWLTALAPMIGATVTNPHIDTIFVPDDETTRALELFWRPVLSGIRSIRFMRDADAAQAWIDAGIPKSSNTPP